MGMARLAFHKRNIKTYRIAFSDLAAVSGVMVEIIGAADKKISIRHIQISKPSTALTPLTIEKLSAASTGGTSTSPTPVPLAKRFAAFSGTVKLYTVAPTKGALIDQIQEIDIGTGDVMNEHYGGEDGGGRTVELEAVDEVLVLVGGVTTTLNGYIEFQEEP